MPRKKTFRLTEGKSPLGAVRMHQIPTHTVYVEPFGGDGVVLFAKNPSSIEVLNDTRGRVLNFKRVLSDKDQRQLLEELWVKTNFLKADREIASQWLLQTNRTPVERAWAFSVLLAKSLFGVVEFQERNRGRTLPEATETWNYRNYHLEQLKRWEKRMQGVEITQKNPFDAIALHDSPDTLHFLEPPFSPKKMGRKQSCPDVEEGYFQKFLEVMRKIKGNVILSTYYRPELAYLREAGWRVIRRSVQPNARTATGSGKKKPPQKSLFVKKGFRKRRRGVPLIERVIEIIQTRESVTVRVLRQFTHASEKEVLRAISCLVENGRVFEEPTQSRNRNKRSIIVYHPTP